MQQLYLDLIKHCITNTIYCDGAIKNFLRNNHEFDYAARETGKEWPIQAHTMIGLKRMDNIQYCVE